MPVEKVTINKNLNGPRFAQEVDALGLPIQVVGLDGFNKTALILTGIRRMPPN